MAVPVSGASRRDPKRGYVRPRTVLGAVSLWSLVGFLLVFTVTRLLVPTVILGQGGATIFSNLAISIPMFVSGILALSAFLLGASSFFRGERSVLVGLGAVVGLGVTAIAIALLIGG